MKCKTFLGSAFATPIFFALLLVGFLPIRAKAQEKGPASVPNATKQQLAETYGKLPLSFEANMGQTDSQVKFLSRGQGYTLFLTHRAETVLVLNPSDRKDKRQGQADTLPAKVASRTGSIAPAVFRMKLVDAKLNPEVEGLGALSGHTNYLIGNDPKKWRTNVPLYAKVNFHEVYPGVDLAYYGNHQQLEYDFIVAPQADPGSISMVVEGAKLSLDAQGDLVLACKHKEIRFQKPVAYQEVDGERQEIPSAYLLKGAHKVGFQIAAYDRSRPLIIDPVLAYSTYLGGSGGYAGGESAYGIAVDSSGNAYVTGITGSTDFPTTPGAFQTTGLAACQSSFGCDVAAFVTKLNPEGSALVYSTYLGGRNGNGNSRNYAYGIAVDSSGNAYVTGKTCTTDFPTTAGAFQTIDPSISNGYGSGFVTKLNASGTGLVYSTYLGGTGAYPGQMSWTCDYSDTGYGIAVDSTGNAYVTGNTAGGFPTTPGAFQPAFSGPPGCCNHTSNAFVVKLNPTGSALVYSTYLGGNGGWDQGMGIALGAGGSTFVTGYTNSTDFPTTPGAFQTSILTSGYYHAFVAKLNPVGSSLSYSTYLAGSGMDVARAIAVDPNQDAYVTGNTTSPNFPATLGAFQFADPGPGGSHAFVTKLNDTGSALAYSTYLGGTGSDLGASLAMDPSGDAFITGYTSSLNFPTTTDAIQPLPGGGSSDAFVTALNPQGAGLVYSSYLSGGGGGNAGYGIALDTAFNVYVAGWTQSPIFPTTSGAYQTSLRSTNNPNVTPANAFVTKIANIACTSCAPGGIPLPIVSLGTSQLVSEVVSNPVVHVP